MPVVMQMPRQPRLAPRAGAFDPSATAAATDRRAHQASPWPVVPDRSPPSGPGLPHAYSSGGPLNCKAG